MTDSSPVSAGHPDMDYSEHEGTYTLFLTLLKWLIGVVVVVLIFLAYMWG